MLVLGGGIVGLFCAYYLRRSGATVTLAERGAIGGPGSCSYGNTGFVGTQGSAPLAEPGVMRQGLRWLADPRSPFSIRPRPDADLVSWLWHFRRCCDEQTARAVFRVLLEMKQRSLAILTDLCASGTLAPTFTAPGIVVAYRTPEAFEKARKSLPQAVALGVPLRILAPEELAALEPEAEFDISGAMINDEGAALRVPEFVTEFARMLQRDGVELCPDTEAVGFETAGDQVTRVITTRGDFTPGEVVIAAGAWSAACARQLGVRGLAMQPAKGYSVTVRAPSGGPRRPVLLSEGKVALAPLGDRLRFGGTLELAGLDTTISARRVDGIRRTVSAYLPRLETTETVETWSGLRPCTPDSVPFIGRAGGYRNLSVAFGHGYIGMGLAPATGELVAQIVTGKEPDIDPAPFRTDRFQRQGRVQGQGRGRGRGRRA